MVLRHTVICLQYCFFCTYLHVFVHRDRLLLLPLVSFTHVRSRDVVDWVGVWALITVSGMLWLHSCLPDPFIQHSMCSHPGGLHFVNGCKHVGTCKSWALRGQCGSHGSLLRCFPCPKRVLKLQCPAVKNRGRKYWSWVDVSLKQWMV